MSNWQQRLSFRSTAARCQQYSVHVAMDSLMHIKDIECLAM